METVAVRHKLSGNILLTLLILSALIPINESLAQRYNNYNYQVMQQQQRQQQMMQQQRQAEANRRAMEQQRRQQEQMRRDMQRQRDAALQRQRQMQQQMQQRQQQAMLQRQRLAERQNQMALKRQQNQQAQQRQSQNALKQQNQQQQRLALQQQREVKIRKERINRIKRERDRTNKNQKKKAQAQTLLALSTTQALRLNNNDRFQSISKNPSQFKKHYQADQQKSRQLQQTLQLRKNAEIKLQKSKFVAMQLQKKSNFKRTDKAKKDEQKAKLLAQKKFSQCKGGECKLRTGNCSFHGDTLVKTKDGYEPIKSLKVGEDWVWSRNEFTGEMDWKPIIALFSNNYPQTVEVTVTNPETNTSQVVRSNRIHEFYISRGNIVDSNFGTNQGGVWIQAQNLQPGDLVLTSSEKLLSVDFIKFQNIPIKAFNITVDELHTYFISEQDSDESIWVHNACNDDNHAAAKALGYTKRIPPQKAPFNSHGQDVFFNGKRYITRDVTEHNVSNGWKMFSKNGRRIGTYDSKLNYVKK